MEEIISVVVPIYKVEKYLEKCIKSILEQTYKKLDIILVDDESPDECGKIIERYKEKDSRIRTIHQKNGGLSDARNNGWKIARGEYILFIDSDDWIEKNMIEILYNNAKVNNADISICEFIEEDDDGNVLSSKKYNNEIRVFTSLEAIKELIQQNNITNHAWNKMYKTELFENIKYPKGQLMEDISTTYKLIESSDRVVYQSIPLYHYIQRGTSILGNITEKRINDQENAFFERNKYLSVKYPQYRKEIIIDNLLNVKNIYYLSVIGKYKNLYNSKKYKDYYKQFKPLYKEYKKELYDKDKTSLRLFYYNRNLYKLFTMIKSCIKEIKK